MRLRVSARARRVSLRLDAARARGGRHRAHAAAAGRGRRLRRERAGWIAARLAELPAPRRSRPALMIEVLGAALPAGRARPAAPRWRRPATHAPLSLLGSGEGEAFARAVVRALKAEARRALVERTEVHAAALGQPDAGGGDHRRARPLGLLHARRARGFGAGVESAASAIPGGWCSPRPRCSTTSPPTSAPT